MLILKKAKYSSTLTGLNGCCLFFNVVRTKQIVRTGVRLYAVGNTYIILLFSHTTVSMEVNPRMEVIL